MAYPVSWRGNAARSGGSLSRPFGSPLAGRIGIPANPPMPANDNFRLPTPANDNFAPEVAFERRAGGAMRFPRVTMSRLLFAYAAFELFELWRQRIPNGARQLDLRGDWDLVEQCRSDGDSIRWNSTYTSCGASNVIGPSVDQGPQTGPIKGFTVWKTLPTVFYINGYSIVATGAATYSHIGGDPGPRLNAAFETPMADWPNPLTHGNPAINPIYLPNPFPALNPSATPINAWSPVGQPIPWSVLPSLRPDPQTPLSVQHQVGYAEGLPDVAFRPSAVEVTALNARAIAPEHAYATPGKGVHERKAVLNRSSGMLIRRLYDAATEVDDFVSAIYKNVSPPKGGKKLAPTYWKDPLGRWHKRWPSFDEKAVFIYKNYRNINIVGAIHDVALNELQDRFYGTLGRTAKKAAQHVYRETGHSMTRAPQLTRAAGHF